MLQGPTRPGRTPLPSVSGLSEDSLKNQKYEMLAAPGDEAVTLAGPDEECSYEEMFVYIQPAPRRAAMAVEHSLKTSGCDEMPFV